MTGMGPGPTGGPSAPWWPTPMPLAKRPQRVWHLMVYGTLHSLEIRARWWRWESGPRLFLDGQRAGNLESPRAGRPRTERPLSLAGVEIVVALEWRRDWSEYLRVDLFVNGVSQLDGRSLAEARATPLDRIDGYDASMGPVQASWSRNGWIIPVAAAIGAFSGSRNNTDPGLGIAIALGIAGAAIAWGYGIYFVNGWNLQHPSLGRLRWLSFAGAVVAPLVLFPVAVAILLAVRG